MTYREPHGCSLSFSQRMRRIREREQGLSLSISSLLWESAIREIAQYTLHRKAAIWNLHSHLYIFSAVSCSSLSGSGGQRQWSPTHDPPFVPQ